MPTRVIKVVLHGCADCPYNLPAPPNWHHRCYAQFSRGRVIRRRPRSFPPSCPLPTDDPDLQNSKN
jgi:hypothetical protein